MCRMLLAVGNFNGNKILDDFLRICSSENEVHELNKNKAFKHNHGFGVIYRKNGKLVHYKSEESILTIDFEIPKTDLLVLHARRTPKLNVVYENTHPFKHKEMYLVHNGTIFENLEVSEKLLGNTDSEKLIHYLLKDGKDIYSIKTKLNEIIKFSGLNFILLDENNIYVNQNFSKWPKYYTMKYLKNDDLLIISSEKLNSYIGWKKLKNKLYKIDKLKPIEV